MSVSKQAVKSVTFSTPYAGTVDDLSNERFDRPTDCRNHLGHTLNYYCAFCEKPICLQCKRYGAHARHEKDIKGSIALARAARSRRGMILKLLNKKEHFLIHAIRGVIFQVNEEKAKFQGRVENAIRRYKQYASTHRDKLITPEEDWIETVQHRANTYLQTINAKMNYLKEFLLQTEIKLKSVKCDIDGTSNAELLLTFGTLRSTLESMHPPIWPREEVMLTLQVNQVPEFGPTLLKAEKVRERNFTVEFVHEIVEPLVYSRVFDSKIPIPKKLSGDTKARLSMTSGEEMYIAFGNYIFTYSLDNRRRKQADLNVKFRSVMSVRDNIIDISCDQRRNVFFIIDNAVKAVTRDKKIIKCFPLLTTPSTLCVTRDGRRDLYIGFRTVGNILKVTCYGEPLVTITHSDPRLNYLPAYMALNQVGGLLFSDGVANITVLDENGIWKGTIGRDVKTMTSYGPLRPTGIACSPQRHIYIIDDNPIPQLHVFSEEGKYLQTIVFKNLQKASVLNVDRTGDIWVGFSDGRIRIYRPGHIDGIE